MTNFRQLSSQNVDYRIDRLYGGLVPRSLPLLLQASPSAAHHRLSRVLIEAGLLDGVIECRDQVSMRPRAIILARLRSSHRRRCVVVL